MGRSTIPCGRRPADQQDRRLASRGEEPIDGEYGRRGVFVQLRDQRVDDVTATFLDRVLVAHNLDRAIVRQQVAKRGDVPPVQAAYERLDELPRV